MKLARLKPLGSNRGHSTKGSLCWNNRMPFGEGTSP